MKDAVIEKLTAAHPWAKLLEYHSRIDSTNTRAAQLGAQGAPHGTVILADSQSAGRGRMGRSFHSPSASGIYLSVLLRPGCHGSELMHLTCAVAVAMCDALEEATGCRPGIKWTNDLVLGKKKVGGILTELSLAADGTVQTAIVGIGINCCQQEQDFPEDIRSIATSLAAHTGRSIDRGAVAAAMIRRLHRMSEGLQAEKISVMDRYRQDCITLGQQVSVLRGDEVLHGKAVGLDADGGMLLQLPNGETRCISSGEVSIRGMYGYVN